MIKQIGMFFFALLLAPPVHAAVLINEIYPKPSDEISEWIELYNNGTESISLDRWTLQNASGEVKTFMMNASFIIAARSFLTFPKSQTGITLNNEGDTVTLRDANNTLMDSQGYPSILGYNTSVGRTEDGSGIWTTCNTPATPNGPNNCPRPSPTATPLPTNTPLATATPMPLPTATPTPMPQTFGTLLPSPTVTQVLGASDNISPTPAGDMLQLAISKSWIAYILLGIAAAALSWMVALWLARTRLMRKKKLSEHK